MPTTEKWVEIKTQKQLKSLLRDYFLDLDAAAHDPARQVAWCTSVGPCEILSAFGFAVYFPENHGALLGARKVSHQFIPHAVNTGYCAESCSYMNSDIGAALAGYSPLQDAYGIPGPPAPDILVYSTNQCREVQDWWSFFGRRHRAPVFGIRPPTHLGAVTFDMVRYVRSQLFELIDQIEGATGRKFSLPKLEEVVHQSSRASTLWNKVLDTARNHPSPLTFFDGLIHMAPVVVMRGSQEAIDYYETLLLEMQQRVHEGISAIPDERHRLYWEGMPVWPKIRELSEKFFDLRAVIAASTYCNSWAFAEYEGGDPLDWMARTSIEIFINRDEEYKQSFLADMFARFDIDGAIFHNARTCPNNTNSRFGMTRRIRDELDMPVLVFDGDLSDVRFFSTAQTMTNIEAFIEQLEGAQAMNGSLYVGIDAGSSATKCVVVDIESNLLGTGVTPSGFDYSTAAERVLAQALEQAGLSRENIVFCVLTGYGRGRVTFADRQMTEITCHARGAVEWYPEVEHIVDIGGQDTKVIRVDPHGKMADYRMNAKCAAGTGAFLESIALRLGLPLTEIDALAMQSTSNTVVNSYCTVFAGTEVLERIKEGQSPEDISMGLFRSIASRVFEMFPFCGGPIAATGGVVTYCRAMVRALEEVLKRPVLRPPLPQHAGAYGGALLAREFALSRSATSHAV